MWRNGAAGPKTLCNACGVKYQRRMHKQKVAADAAAAAAAASAAAGEDGDIGSRLNRSMSGVLRSAQEISGPPVLTRRSCNRAEASDAATAAASADTHAGEQPRTSAPQGMATGAAGARTERRSAAGEAKARKARRLEEQPTRRSPSPQQTTSAQTSFAAFPAAASPAAQATPHHASVPANGAPSAQPPSASAVPLPGSSGTTRLDGLQMQMAGRNGAPIVIPGVTVLLQPVTRAQSLWTGGTARTPSVALYVPHNPLCLVLCSQTVSACSTALYHPKADSAIAFTQRSHCRACLFISVTRSV